MAKKTNDAAIEETSIFTRTVRAVNALTGGRLKEAVIPAATIDDDPRAGEYRRLSTRTRDLLPMQYDAGQQMSFYLWQRNPVARRMIQILVDFCTRGGTPVKVKIKTTDAQGQTTDTDRSDAQGVWDEFARDPINRIDQDMPTFLQDILINGELVLPTTTALALQPDGTIAGNGKVRIGYIDPANIKEIVPMPMNIREIVSVKAQAVNSTNTIELPVIRIDTDPTHLATYEHYVGACFYFRINRVTNQLRGHGQLLDSADWLDALDQFLFDALEGFRLRNSFFYDLTLKGMTEEEIQAYMAKVSVPSNGAMRAHNENASYDVVTPDLKAMDIEKALLAFQTFVVGNKGFPIMWFGSGADTNKATAGEMSIPTLQMIKAVQEIVRNILKTMALYVCDVAVQARTITLAENEAIDVEVSLYDFERKDAADIGQGFTQMVSGLTLAVDKGWVSEETAKKVMDGFISRIGVEVDQDETVEENLAEQAAHQDQGAAGAYAGAGAPPGNDQTQQDQTQGDQTQGDPGGGGGKQPPQFNRQGEALEILRTY